MTTRQIAEAFIQENLPIYLQVLHNLATQENRPHLIEMQYQARGTLTDRAGKQKLPGDPQELVLTDKKEVYLPPDRQSAEYLIDRILGKPTTQNTPSQKELPKAFTPQMGIGRKLAHLQEETNGTDPITPELPVGEAPIIPEAGTGDLLPD